MPDDSQKKASAVTKDIIESIGIKKAYEKAENAQLIIFLIDSNKFSIVCLLKFLMILTGIVTF